MTPKEKAKSLFKEYEAKMLRLEYTISGFVIPKLAKDSAIICVEQIIEAVTTIADKKYYFYNKVLEHLKQL